MLNKRVTIVLWKPLHLRHFLLFWAGVALKMASVKETIPSPPSMQASPSDTSKSKPVNMPYGNIGGSGPGGGGGEVNIY